MLLLLCLDEIIWPDEEDALPSDAEDLISRLLRQNPMDRLGTGTSVPNKNTSAFSLFQMVSHHGAKWCMFGILKVESQNISNRMNRLTCNPFQVEPTR